MRSRAEGGCLARGVASGLWVARWRGLQFQGFLSIMTLKYVGSGACILGQGHSVAAVPAVARFNFVVVLDEFRETPVSESSVC